jgi:hypothetical protein
MKRLRRHLLDSERESAMIVYPARAMTGVRHVVVQCLDSETSFGTDSCALCGINVDNFYGEHKKFDPKTIGCKRCKAVWERGCRA